METLLNVVKPQYLTAAKSGAPRAVIGVGEGRPTMTMYGTQIGGGGVGAVVACEPFTDGNGRRSYCIVACGTALASEFPELLAEARRQLAAADHPKAPEPQKPAWMTPKARTDQEAMARRTARKKAAKAETQRLDELGAKYATRAEGEPDMGQLLRLFHAGRIVGAARETRGPLHELRRMVDTNQLWPSPTIIALCRSIGAVA